MPPSNTHGFAVRSMSLRDMPISESDPKNSWPNLGYAYVRIICMLFENVYCFEKRTGKYWYIAYTVDYWYSHQISNLLQKTS